MFTSKDQSSSSHCGISESVFVACMGNEMPVKLLLQ